MPWNWLKGGLMTIDNIRQWITVQMNKAERMHCCNGISEYRASVMIADLFIEKQKELDAKEVEIERLMRVGVVDGPNYTKAE
jgi:hypothetical protein